MENVLYMDPAILEAAFIGMPDEKWSEAVKAVVVLKGGPHGHRGGDHRLLQGNIAHYKAPKSVDFIRELPKTASGKIYKRGLRISTRGRRGKRSCDKNEGGSISRIHFSSVSHRFVIQTWDNQHLV